MNRITTLTKISFSLAAMAAGFLVLAHALGFVPDQQEIQNIELQSQRTIAESAAVQLSLAAEKGDWATIRTLIDSLSKRSPAIAEITLTNHQGRVLASTTPNSNQPAEFDPSTSADTLRVPIFRNRLPWGEARFKFKHIDHVTGPVWWGTSLLPMTTVVGCSCFLAFMFYLRRVLTHLDPSSVIPERVRSALDTLAEGLIVVDPNGRVVLANRAFLDCIGWTERELLGRQLSSLLWIAREAFSDDDYPWNQAMKNGDSQTNVILKIADQKNKLRSFSVNAVPVLDAKRISRGAMVTFDDLTNLEEKNTSLNELLRVLERSNREIQSQNQELQFLATRDPLTGCFNRRAFFAKVEETWLPGLQSGRAFACIMCDIDHFKAFNDNYGHAVGDRVLSHVASILRGSLRETDLLCRYGGEEFCIVLPDVSPNQARELAEHLRKGIETKPLDNLRITSSFGVAIGDPSAPQFASTLEQADKCLYGSKRRGRNRVTTWADLVEYGETEIQSEKVGDKKQGGGSGNVSPISHAAVQSMFQALMNRDPATAEHSRRVANLCVVVGQQFLSEQEVEILEAAALLHDIGKLGVPDSVLMKAGPLSPEEWKVMRAHDEIGSDLVELAFNCKELCEIVRTYHAWYQGDPSSPDLPTSTDIPVSARILAMADAYDAMVSDRVYRLGRSHEEALAELKRCAGAQFDPALIERFSGTISSATVRSSLPATGDFSSKKRLELSQVQYLANGSEDNSIQGVKELVEGLAALVQEQRRPSAAEIEEFESQTTALCPTMAGETD